jgi:hypothetical protein
MIKLLKTLKMKTSFIDYCNVNFDNIQMKQHKCNNNNCQFYTPLYSYIAHGDKAKYPLIIKTEFINLAIDPFKFLFNGTKKHISIDSNDASFMHLRTFFTNFIEHVRKFIVSKSKAKTLIFANSSQFINFKDKEITDKNCVKFYFWNTKNGDKLQSQIYNYNKSTNYKRVESYSDITLHELSRFLLKNKQARFWIEPNIWYNKDVDRINNISDENEKIDMFGIKFFIRIMEVKYSDHQIKSKADKLQETFVSPIKEIQI